MTRFRMTKIAIEQFAILAKSLPEEGISLTTELAFEYSTEAQAIACTATFDFFTSVQPILKLACKCEFKIHPDDWKDIESSIDGAGIPRFIMELFAVHTIGTSRGILFCKTEGTAFNALTIPPINVVELMGDEKLEKND